MDIEIYFKPILFVVDGKALSGKIYDFGKKKVLVREDNTDRLWEVGLDNLFDINGYKLNLKP